MSCDCNPIVVGEAGPQGAQGLAGTNGTNGTNGINAFTTLTTQFTQPSVSGSVTIVVGNNQWIATGQAIYISGAGFYTATSFSGTTDVVCTLVQADGIAPGNPVSSGRKISPSAIATYAAPLSSLTVNGDSSLDGAVVVNETGADKDVRVEGDTDINLLRTDASTDRVGVGIAAPETKFHVAGGFKVGTAASGADALFTQAATFNDNQASAGDFAVKSQNFSAALFVDASTDRVGIGTNTPSKLLDVAGAMETNTILVNPAGVAGTEVLKVLGTSSAVPLVVDATNNRVGVKTASPSVELDVTGAAKISGNLAVDTNVLFVDTSTNRVGINDATPSYSLDVTGDANITSTLDVGGNTTLAGTLNVTGTSTLAAVNASGAVSVDGNLTVDSGVLFVNTTSNCVGINTTGAITDASLIVAGGDLVVDTNTLFVDASTNRVGVKNTSPATDFDVTGNAAISGSFTVDTDVLVVDAANNRIGINQATPNVALDVVGQTRLSNNLAVDTNVLYVDTGTNRVGINDSTPSTDLDVNGAVQATSYQIESGAAKITKLYQGSVSLSSSTNLTSLTGAGTYQTYTHGLTGVAAGDFAQVTYSSSDNNFEDSVMISAYCTTGNVNIVFFNMSSTNYSTTNASITINILVTRAAAS